MEVGPKMMSGRKEADATVRSQCYSQLDAINTVAVWLMVYPGGEYSPFLALISSFLLHFPTFFRGGGGGAQTPSLHKIAQPKQDRKQNWNQNWGTKWRGSGG